LRRGLSSTGFGLESIELLDRVIPRRGFARELEYNLILNR